jgi:hypothetical protein
MNPKEIDLINDILLELTDELNEKGYVLPENRMFKNSKNSISYSFPESNALSSILETEVTKRLEHKSLNFSTKIKIESNEIILTVTKS